MPRARFEQLQHLTAVLGVSQSRLFSAFVTVLTEEQIATILKSYDRVEEIEEELMHDVDQRLLQFIRGKSPADLEIMLQAARNGKAA